MREHLAATRPQNRPEHVANITMRTAVARFTFDWDFSWQSNQLGSSSDKVGDYPLVNLQVGYDVNDKLNLFVRGENLTDERSSNRIGYQRRGAGVYFGIKGRI